MFGLPNEGDTLVRCTPLASFWPPFLVIPLGSMADCQRDGAVSNEQVPFLFMSRSLLIMEV